MKGENGGKKQIKLTGFQERVLRVWIISLPTNNNLRASPNLIHERQLVV